MYQVPIAPNELYHHGILGQKWGKQNGPPYPLSNSTINKVYGNKQKRSGISEYIQSQKEKREIAKNIKSERKEEKKRDLEEASKKKRELDKERVLREGSAIEVLQYSNELTVKELQDAVSRIKWQKDLEQYAKKEAEKGWKQVDDVMKKVGNIKDWTKIGVELMETIDKASKLIDKKQGK